MDIEVMREEFEAEMLEQFELDLKTFRKTDDTGFDGYCLDGCFSSQRSQLATVAWMMWQKSRESLVIVLPKRKWSDADLYIIYGDSDERGDHIEYDETVKAIQSAGLNYK